MPLSWVFGLVAIAAPFLTYGVMRGHEVIAVHEAVRIEHSAGVASCSARILGLASEIQLKQAQDANDAQKASEDVTVTPEDRTALAALCASSASCRDRGKK